MAEEGGEGEERMREEREKKIENIWRGETAMMRRLQGGERGGREDGKE